MKKNKSKLGQVEPEFAFNEEISDIGDFKPQAEIYLESKSNSDSLDQDALVAEIEILEQDKATTFKRVGFIKSPENTKRDQKHQVVTRIASDQLSPRD